MTMSTLTTTAHEGLARDLDRHADALDKFADAVEAWGAADVLSPRMALGLISTSDQLVATGTRLIGSDIIGINTRHSHGNEAAIALGVDRWGRAGTNSMGYSIIYALGTVEQYGPDSAGKGHRMDVKAASIRCYASSCRVVASIATDVAAGKYSRIG